MSAISSHFEPILAIWSYLDIFGAVWSYLELSRAILSYLELFGAFWSYLELFGAFWSYLVPFGPFPTSFSTFPTFPTFLLFLHFYFSSFSSIFSPVCSRDFQKTKSLGSEVWWQSVSKLSQKETKKKQCTYTNWKPWRRPASLASGKNHISLFSFFIYYVIHNLNLSSNIFFCFYQTFLPPKKEQQSRCYDITNWAH